MDNDVIGESKLEEIDLPQNEDYRVDLAARSTGVDMGYTYMSNREESYIKSTIKIFTEDITDGTGTITIELKTPVVARYVKVNSLHNNRDGEYIAENDSTLGLDQSTPFTIYKLEGGGRNEFFLYDEKGNRVKKTIMDEGVEISPYEYYPNSDWLKTDSKYDYAYDENGNRKEKTSKTTDERWTYTYDLRNRLEQVKKWDSETSAMITTATYTYDSEGYRIKKTDRNNLESLYVFDSIGNMIEEIKDGNSERYVFMGMTHIAKINDDDSRKYYGTNHLGSTTLITDEDGIEVFNEETNPFGDQVEKGMFFTGKQWDEDAQLYYFNARWYDPETGRFITEDPVKDSSLWYAYVSNNPLKYIDPTGKVSLLEAEAREQVSQRQEQKAEEEARKTEEETQRRQERKRFWKTQKQDFSDSFDPYRDGWTKTREEGLGEGLKELTNIHSFGDAFEVIDDASIALMGAGGVSLYNQMSVQGKAIASRISAKTGAVLVKRGFITPMRKGGGGYLQFIDPKIKRYKTSSFAEQRKSEAFQDVKNFGVGFAVGYMDAKTPVDQLIAPEVTFNKPRSYGQKTGYIFRKTQEAAKEIFKW